MTCKYNEELKNIMNCRYCDTPNQELCREKIERKLQAAIEMPFYGENEGFDLFMKEKIEHLEAILEGE